MALVVLGNSVNTVAESEEKAKSEANNNSIWKSICDGCSDRLKQQSVINRLQQQVDLLEQESAELNQQDNERLAEMETSISKVVVALNTTQLALGTRAQVVYEAVSYMPTTARVIDRPRPNPSGNSTNPSSMQAGRSPHAGTVADQDGLRTIGNRQGGVSNPTEGDELTTHEEDNLESRSILGPSQHMCLHISHGSKYRVQ